MKIKSLLEEFKTGFKSKGKYYEVYWVKGDKRFGSSDLKAMREWRYGVRFALDLDKDCLYVWNQELLHEHAAMELNLEYTSSSIPETLMLFGEAKLEEKYLVFAGSYMLSHAADEAPRDDDYYKLLKRYKEKIMSSDAAKNLMNIIPAIVNRINKADDQRAKIAQYEKAYKERV